MGKTVLYSLVVHPWVMKPYESKEMITIKLRIVVIFGGREGPVFGVGHLEELLAWLVF